MLQNIGKTFLYLGLAVLVWMIIFWGISTYRAFPPTYHGSKAATLWLYTFADR